MPEIMKALFHDFFTFVILIKCHPAGFPILPECPFLWEKGRGEEGDKPKRKEETRREEEQKVREQLAGDVFPRIDAEIRRQVEMNLNRTMLEIKTAVNSDLDLQMEALQNCVLQG